MKKLYFITNFIFLNIYIQAQNDSIGPIRPQIFYDVVRVTKFKDNQDSISSFGTGFLVSTNAGKINAKTYLVTNKHMIGKWNPLYPFQLAPKIIIDFYVADSLNKFKPVTIFLLVNSKPAPQILLDPNNKVDVAVIDITNALLNTNTTTNSFDILYLTRLEKVKDVYSYGTHVFTLGYPSNIKSFLTNLPIAKSGFLATSLEGNFVVEERYKENISSFLSEGKLFLIDGLIVGGNSGGPVVLTRELYQQLMPSNDIRSVINTENLVIGIVSSTWEPAGITVAFASNHILDLIESYEKSNQ